MFRSWWLGGVAARERKTASLHDYFAKLIHEQEAALLFQAARCVSAYVDSRADRVTAYGGVFMLPL